MVCFDCVKAALMQEAKLMANLNSEFIVRLLGVCKIDSVLLVMELAGLGQLHKYLKKSQYDSLTRSLTHSLTHTHTHSLTHCSPIVTLSIRCTIFEIFDFKNAMTLKLG